jgi:hypothetical protein
MAGRAVALRAHGPDSQSAGRSPKLIPIARQAQGMVERKKHQRIPVMMSPRDMAAIDAWRRRQSDGPGRSEAARRLIEHALAVLGPARRSDPTARAAAASYAEQAAGEAIDDSQKHSGQSTKVKAARKKRLTQVPRELAKRSPAGG